MLPDLRLGLAAGYTSNSARTQSRLSTASGDAGHVAAYADWRMDHLSFELGGDYGFGTVRIVRSIPQLGFMNSSAQDQDTGQVFGDIGYRLALDEVEFQPHATIAHIVASSGAFAEAGDVSALSGEAKSDSQTYGFLGLRAAVTHIHLNEMYLVPRLDVGWQHALSSFLPGQFVTYQDAGTSFLVLGTPLARDAAAVQAGFDLSLGAATLFIGYDGSFASTTENHAIRGGLDWRF